MFPPQKGWKCALHHRLKLASVELKLDEVLASLDSKTKTTKSTNVSLQVPDAKFGVSNVFSTSIIIRNFT